MKNALLSSAALGIVLSSAGCLQERTYLDTPTDINFADDTGFASNMSVRNGRLRGDFGGRRGFDGAATDLQGSNDAEYRMTTVNVVREEAGRGAGMVIFSTSGRTLDELPVGEHAFSYDDEAAFDGEQEIFINVCGGSDATAFDYDAPARSGTVTIEEDASGNRTVSIHTETPLVDSSTGIETGAVETSDSAFVYSPSR